MDAITLLKQDHKAVETLFKKFEKAGENADHERFHAKVTAPTHPRPKAPDMAPGNRVAGALAGVVDRVRG